MAYAYNSTGDAKYIDGVTTAMDYIFGTNALDFSYVTGYGSYYCQRPHHRLWSYELDKSFPMAPKGVMSGGPGSGMQDPYIGGLGYKRGTLAAQKCYVDSIEAWSVNEVTINWNAPLAWVTSFLDDFGNDEGGSPVTKPTSGKTDPTSPDVKVSLYGDANCDGKVDISDAVLIKCYLLNSSSYPISAQGLANSDVQGNKNGVNAQDAVTIQKYILKAITSLPV
ncbi:glycosyl hydrolase family 9./Carbohydrate binding domain./N-terminal ig-like domain of cellulase [Ruminococcus sp. CAG:624]|nr:glycosyl hydrolase family 9./Carbohydrate binding domain./N-terminal ig-like domain of cellulase [Ruminococcus sp. CAG:624]